MFSKAVYKKSARSETGAYSLRLEYPAPGLCGACDLFFEKLISAAEKYVPYGISRSVCADICVSFSNDALCSLFWDIISYNDGSISGYTRFTQLWDLSSDRLVRLPALVKTGSGAPVGCALRSPDGFYLTPKELCVCKSVFPASPEPGLRRSDCKKYLQEERLLLADCALLPPFQSLF